MKLDQAMTIARTCFREYLGERIIPEEVARRLSVGAIREGKDWIVEISLFEEDPSVSKAGKAGLTEDLMHPLARPIVSIAVDSQTGKPTLAEVSPVPW